jgi:hypothetical protein
LKRQVDWLVNSSLTGPIFSCALNRLTQLEIFPARDKDWPVNEGYRDFATITCCDVCSPARIREPSVMNQCARIFFICLFFVSGVFWGDMQRVIMPKEIGVSCRKHKPFTAVARTTLTRIFPSGIQRTVTVEDRIARDGEGRVMSEQHLPWTEEPDRPVYYINILDPENMEHIHIDPQQHTFTKRPVDRRYAWDYVPYDGTQYRLVARPGVTVHTQLLGNKEINGSKCWGQLTTYRFQPGAFQGNQQPVEHTWEVWYAKDLGSDVRIVDHNPDRKAGDQETDLIDIKYGDPDPSIFSSPASYSN